MNLKILLPTLPLWLPILVIIIILWTTSALEITETNKSNNSMKFLSRKRRFLAFPEGSSIAVALCMTHGYVPTVLFPGYPISYISIATNWGLAYNLPNASWIIHQLRKSTIFPHHKPVVLRRNRRQLYESVEIIIDKMGYNGRDCVLRALCESAQYFDRKKKGSMLEEILKTIFSFPKYRLFSFESPDIKEYDEAYRYGHKIDDCSTLYNGCEISLIDLAFGKYSDPPPNFKNEDDSDDLNPFPNQD